MADLLAATAAWGRDEGPEPYPLAQACIDHQIALAIGESARRGQPVRTSTEPWSGHRSTGAAA